MPLHCMNARRSMVVNESGRVREVSPEHPRKTSDRKHVKLGGSFTKVREEQLLNDFGPMVVKPSGKVSDCRAEQPLKAAFPMRIKESGNVIDLSRVQPLNT